MVTDTIEPTANAIRNRARRLAIKQNDPSFFQLAAQNIGMPEGDLETAAKFLRNAMVDYMAAHPNASRVGPDGAIPGQPYKLRSVGMLLSALGYVPQCLSPEESLHGLGDNYSYDRERESMVRAGL